MKFSVIVPVYNKANTIGNSLNSIKNQTLNDCEIIVIDDGSTDNIDEILKDYNDVVLIRQENSGVSVARNNGIKCAKGEYICFLDADDIWKENHLETLSKLIEKYPKISYFITSHGIEMECNIIKHSNEKLYYMDDEIECHNLIGLLNDTSYDLIHTNSICIKKSILETDNIYFEPGIKIGEDTDVWYRLALYHRVVLTKTETTVYIRSNSTATKISSNIQKWIFSLRESEIMDETGIPDDIKKSVIELLDRYKMTCCREYVYLKKRKEAKQILKLVKNRMGLRFWFTKLFCYIPYFIGNKIYYKYMKER